MTGNYRWLNLIHLHGPCLREAQGHNPCLAPLPVFHWLLQVDVLVTTAGGVEEDLIKCLAPSYIGDFSLHGKALRENGINRYQWCGWAWVVELRVMGCFVWSERGIASRLSHIQHFPCWGKLVDWMLHCSTEAEGGAMYRARLYSPAMSSSPPGLGIFWCPMTITASLRTGWCQSWTRWWWNRIQRWELEC